VRTMIPIAANPAARGRRAELIAKSCAKRSDACTPEHAYGAGVAGGPVDFIRQPLVRVGRVAFVKARECPRDGRLEVPAVQGMFKLCFCSSKHRE